MKLFQIINDFQPFLRGKICLAVNFNEVECVKHGYIEISLICPRCVSVLITDMKVTLVD